MSKERTALLFVGAWIAGSLFVMTVATQNFHTIDRLLTESNSAMFRTLVGELGDGRARDLLRYLSSELNRLYFTEWNVVQLALGAGIFLLVGARPDVRRLRFLASVMLTIVVVMMFWLTPEITTIGRQLDFVPRTPPPAELGRFWILHAVYTSLEVVKLGVAAYVAVLLTKTPLGRAQEV